MQRKSFIHLAVLAAAVLGAPVPQRRLYLRPRRARGLVGVDKQVGEVHRERLTLRIARQSLRIAQPVGDAAIALHGQESVATEVPDDECCQVTVGDIISHSVST